MRTVPEWVAKNDDQTIPSIVRLRIWARCDGKCHITGRKIMPGDPYEFEHIKALCNGGEHREYNIALALTSAHKGKTKRDRAEKSKVDGMRRMNLGLNRAKRTIPGRRFNGDAIPARLR